MTPKKTDVTPYDRKITTDKEHMTFKHMDFDTILM